MEEKRLIEVDFPLKEVSEESVREKNIRHGHISALHIWWARRPLAASRATTYAALIPAPSDNIELRRKLEFVAELSKYDNSLNQRLIDNASKEIRDFFGSPPRVLDCFAGGGAIPLEALRLGCETYALEYNPVAVLILKAMLEYPGKFQQGKIKHQGGLQSTNNTLPEDVKKCANWVLEAAKKEIGAFYPQDPKGSNPVGYIWARTIKCQNPSCGAEIPLMRQLWLAKKGNRKIALKMIVDRQKKTVEFKVVYGKEIDFDPSQGTTRLATVLCPVCGSAMKSEALRKKAREGGIEQRLVAVVLHEPKRSGKVYRIADECDVAVFQQAEYYFKEKIRNWRWDFNPIPDELLPTPDAKEYVDGGLYYNFAPVVLYGMKRWGDLFNIRQKLTLITLIEKVKLAYEKLIQEGCDEEYSKVMITYVSFIISRFSDFENSFVRWGLGREVFTNLFARQAIPMVWDYVEANPLSTLTNILESMFRQNIRVINNLTRISTDAARVYLGTATRLPFDDEYFDAVITDPPYYDNVPYSYISDFFYVWLKRAIGDLHPDLFATPLTPKSQEIIDNLSLLRGMAKDDASKSKEINVKDRKFFENMITESFKQIYRVLKPDGIAVIVFAHKSTDAWETIINSLLKSGLVLTASWPIHTEMKTRLRAMESAALASSVYMVCRKRIKQETAYFNEIRDEVDQRIKEKLTQFWEQGISGADFFVSAIGPAVEVFGKYSRVEKLSGEEVSVQELLEYVRKVVSEFALERVLKRADLGGVDAETRFYLLWRWTFGNAKVHFDDAIKLSRPMGVELTNLWDKGGFVEKEKEFIKVLDPKERAKDPVFLKKTKFTSMIDVLHHVVILWERGEKEKIKEILNETGYAGNEIFWQTAQAISEILPQGDKEKQLLQGFLYGKEVYVKEAARGKKTLLDFTESG
jgi:adenine-specific DNA methylase